MSWLVKRDPWSSRHSFTGFFWFAIFQKRISFLWVQILVLPQWTTFYLRFSFPKPSVNSLLHQKYLEVSKKHSHMMWFCAILSRSLRCWPWDLRFCEFTKFQEETEQSPAMVLYFALYKNRRPYNGLQGLHNMHPSMTHGLPPIHIHTHKLWPSLPLQLSLLSSPYSPGSSHITQPL